MNAEIETLKNEKNELIKQFDYMAKEHKKKYGNIDISEPKSEVEKVSEAEKNIIACKLNNIVIQINKLKKQK